MNKTQITLKQVCAIFIALLPPLKIITAPSLMAELCAEKLWLPPLLLCLLDVILIFVILKATKKHNYKSVYEILKQTYSQPFAKTILFLWGIFFLLKAFVPILEHKHLIERSFYETLPKAPIFFPFFLTTFYIVLKDLKPLARICQILAPLTILALILIFYLSLSPGDYKTLLPIFNINAKSGAIASLNACLWFNDAIYLIFFTSSFAGEKKPFLKIVISYLIPFFMTVLIYITFFAIFSSIASTKQLAISSMSIFSLTLVNIGRFDHLAVLILSLCSIVAIALPLICSVNCFCTCFNLKKRIFFAIAINLLLSLLTIIFGESYRVVIDFYFKFISPFIFVCGYILPLLLLGDKKYEV